MPPFVQKVWNKPWRPMRGVLPPGLSLLTKLRSSLWLRALPCSCPAASWGHGADAHVQCPRVPECVLGLSLTRVEMGSQLSTHCRFPALGCGGQPQHHNCSFIINNTLTCCFPILLHMMATELVHSLRNAVRCCNLAIVLPLILLLILLSHSAEIGKTTPQLLLQQKSIPCH